MPPYITLWQFTEQGAASIRDSPDRIDRIEEQFEDLGGELESFDMLMGQYDTITISEFPDVETAAQAVLSVTEAGNVRLDIPQVFERDATREGLESMP
ncbi:GYD family protein [Natrialba magadii ATCC 43099]|uniref:GYD family protein n=1 Tax=Natrialba magadii (strain ATCC 43099 / DSM 3394 / CCM 3739 / CIP 104546 / IAM 13178 / JCM 8861 / NBRC 102185 / NCIMB 2190 / MS3) TaxID=547559 RepID=D3SXC2_NATMM|nr:GYD domain-containing protein [Natrialba magadii]ADD03942.1 GYD family protein [Natrialba magadii ATCC 43099]ELY33605.1 GYD family protein [Natrialba magadii ATCC 43099]